MPPREQRLTIIIEVPILPWDAEELEDKLAKVLREWGYFGRIHDDITGNITRFGDKRLIQKDKRLRA